MIVIEGRVDPHIAGNIEFGAEDRGIAAGIAEDAAAQTKPLQQALLEVIGRPEGRLVVWHKPEPLADQRRIIIFRHFRIGVGIAGDDVPAGREAGGDIEFYALAALLTCLYLNP